MKVTISQRLVVSRLLGESLVFVWLILQPQPPSSLYTTSPPLSRSRGDLWLNWRRCTSHTDVCLCVRMRRREQNVSARQPGNENSLFRLSQLHQQARIAALWVGSRWGISRNSKSFGWSSFAQRGMPRLLRGQLGGAAATGDWGGVGRKKLD